MHSRALLLTVFAAGVAHAGGFELPEHGARSLARGGANSVLPGDLSAIALNPGAMIQLSGTHLYLSYNLVNAPLTFERAPSRLAGADEPLPPKSVNQEPIFPLGVFLGISSDFGLDDFNFWLAVYGPNAAGSASYPEDSAARYQLTALDLAMVYYSVGFSWGERDHFGVGATLQWAHTPSSKFQLVIDGAKKNSEMRPYSSPFDVLAKFDLSDAGQATAIIGGWWRIIPELEVALSGRVVPVFVDMEGELELQPIGTFFTEGGGQLRQFGNTASISAVMPPTMHAGFRYRHMEGERERFDIELDVVYEAWSLLEAYDVELNAEVEVIDSAGTQLVPREKVPPLKVKKEWKDTLSVRLGGSVNFLQDRFALSAGAFWESAASPDDYAYVDFASFQRVGVGAGLTFRFTRVDLNLAYMHIFQPDVTVDEVFGQGGQQRPLANCPEGCPDGASYIAANAGTFKSSFDQIGISLDVHFD